MKKVLSLIFIVMLIWGNCMCVFAANDAKQQENPVIVKLQKELDDLHKIKKYRPNEYSKVKEIDLNLKIMLQYMKDGSINGAEGYLNTATTMLTNDAELAPKVQDNVNKLNHNFKSWRASPSEGAYQAIQRDVTQILLIAESDKEDIVGTDKFKIILLLVVIAVILILVYKMLFIKKVK